MNYSQFKERVQSRFPVIFADSLIHSDDPNGIDNILRDAYEFALSKYEKIKNGFYTGTTTLSDAISILKCVPSFNQEDSRQLIEVWDLMGPKVKPNKIKHYFTPIDRVLRIDPEGSSVYVEYLVDTKTLAIEDLNDTYIKWAIKYANALLKIKEGYIGTSAELTALPFNFNYGEMRSGGISERDNLEEKLDEMYSGVLAIRTN